MNRQTLSVVLAVACLLGGLLPGASTAWAQDLLATLSGSVYADANGNAAFDPGEAGLEGIELEVTGETGTQRVVTSGGGTFSLQVPAGTWQVTLLVPEGYSPVNDTTRAVTLAAEGVTEAVMDFALLPPPAAANSDETASTAPPEAAAEAAVETAIDTAPVPPVILPESGAALPPVIFLFLALAVVLAAGLLLILIGHWAAAR